LIGDGDSGDEVYKESAEPMLVSLSELYSYDDRISIGNSRSSSCSAYTIY